MQFKKLISVNFPKLKNIPSGYKRLGNYMFLRSHVELSSELGDAIMQIYSWVIGVYQYITTQGVSRNPIIVHLAGSKNTIIEHKENNLIYILDFSKIMFSGGNSELRKKLIDKVSDGEVLVDMFAAVGNLSLQVVYYNKIHAILIEQNKYTFSFLVKTVERNNIKNTKLINKDCRDTNFTNIADRIFLGYHDVDQTHLKRAIGIAKEKCVLHLHPIAKEGNYEEWEKKYSNWLKDFNVDISSIKSKKIKNYSPGLHHVEMTITINKQLLIN